MDHQEEEILRYRDEHYTPFEEKLDALENVIAHREPNQWWLSIMLDLRRIEREVRKGNTIPEIEDFIKEYFPKIKAILINETTYEANDQALASHDVIHKIGDIFSDEEETEIININHIPLEKLSQSYQDMEIVDSSPNSFTIKIFSHSTNQWWEYSIPKKEDGNILLHKGGLPRVVLKIVAGSPRDMIEAELPLNDVDFIAQGENLIDLYEIALEAGGDKAGVEIVEDINFSQIFKTRDIELNGSLLSEEGLTFSEDAYEAARTGKISILANKRGIYGTEYFHYDGVRLIKNRGMMRLFKTVAEGKALEFNFIPLNKQVDLSIYWLVLANRFSEKPNAGLLLDRLYYLGTQTGQVLESEKNIFDVLDRVHTQMPFFNFDREKLDNLGLTRWLTRKLAKQIDKAYRDKFHIPTYFPFQREEGDTKPYIVNLENYTPNTEIINDYNNRWSKFVLQSRERHRDHKQNLIDEVFTNELE